MYSNLSKYFLCLVGDWESSSKKFEVSAQKPEQKSVNLLENKSTEVKNVAVALVSPTPSKPKPSNAVQNKSVEVNKKVTPTPSKPTVIKTTNKVATNKTTTPAKPAQEKEEAKVANTKKVTTEQSSTKERATSSY